MTDQQYTPTTDLMRRWHVLADHSGNKSTEEYEAEFDRWLNQVKADAWDEGYAASDEEAYFQSTHGCTPNPYRADQMEDTND